MRPMTRSPEEQAQTKRLDEVYVRARSPVMQSIERKVCGCSYGSNSWTTRSEAQRMATLLRLRPGLRLIDLGAGSGWPGLFMAKTTGCDLVLVDLPLAGLQIALQRAGKELNPGTCWIVVADAAMLPLAAGSSDAICHSDLLCCLRQKRAVLENCRRVIRQDGQMVFTVISIAPGLSSNEYRRAAADGPVFVESETDYPTLLRQTGWTTVECHDITLAYGASCRRQAQADTQNKEELQALIGISEFAQRQADWRSQITAIDDGLLRRELFVVLPDRVS
jgi:ubiquinone/menaquinone biosynthesis C-methylase UbiE